MCWYIDGNLSRWKGKQKLFHCNWTELNRWTECNKITTGEKMTQKKNKKKKKKGCSFLPFLHTFLVSWMRFLWTIYDDITFQFFFSLCVTLCSLVELHNDSCNAHEYCKRYISKLNSTQLNSTQLNSNIPKTVVILRVNFT